MRRNSFFFLIMSLFSYSAFAQQSINFPDPNLEAVIREHINKPTGLILQSDLDFSSLYARSRGISDLTGIEACQNLLDLDLKWNKINDITPLAYLPKLTTLVLSDNPISDYSSLSQMDSITELKIRGNSISDISFLETMNNLELLWLGWNHISDISSLHSLTKLKSLELASNYISDISALETLLTLERLNLESNYITDITPLTYLSNLVWLNAQQNCIKDITSLQNLSTLQELYLSYNWISRLTGLTNNQGLGNGDKVQISHNLLTSEAYDIDIPILVGRIGQINFTYDARDPNSSDPVVIDFPVYWKKNLPYTALMPRFIEEGYDDGWSCGQVAHAMIIKYWADQGLIWPSGSYWFNREDNEQKVSVDFSEPINWDKMLPSINGLYVDDPRVFPIADFALKLTTAMRTDWWHLGPEMWRLTYKEVLVKHFGFDTTNYRRDSIKTWLEEYTWSELYSKINEEIDNGQPCELTITMWPEGSHEVVITGYKRVKDHFEYCINFGNSNRYDPSEFYRIDRQILDYNDPCEYGLSLGIIPFIDPNKAVTYNKIDEFSGSLEWYNKGAIAWNGHEYGLILPMGTSDTRGLVFQTIKSNGFSDPNLYQLINHYGGASPRPSIVWGNECYAIAWQDERDAGACLYFNMLSSNGESLLSEDIIIAENAGWPSLAFNGNNYGLVWEESSHIKFLLITSDGVPLWDSLLDLGRKKNPSIIWAGNKFAISWITNASLQLAILSPQGQLETDISTITFSDATRCDESAIAYCEDGFGIAWIKEISSDRRIVCFCKATETGQLLSGSIIEISDRGGKARNIDMSYYNGQFYLTYRHCCNYEAYLCRISKDAEILETKWLFDSTESISHALGENTLCILQMRNFNNNYQETIEVETCIVPLVP